MNIKNNWDKTPAYDGSGERERMTPGGHVCTVLDVKLTTSRSGREQLVLFLEIAEGSSLDGFYGRQYKRRQQNTQPGMNPPAWPCRFFQNTEDGYGNASPYFKGLVAAFEESNAGYKWNWNENSLRRLKIGFVFREEEYLSYNNEVKTNIKPAFVCSVQMVRDGVEVPVKKTIGGADAPVSAASGFTPVYDDEDLPF